MTDLADLVARAKETITQLERADKVLLRRDISGDPLGAAETWLTRNAIQRAITDLATLQAEKDALRTTNQRLNRRAQELEATIAEDRRILGEASERGFSHNFLAAYHENIALKARVRAAEQALADEREACAKIAERDVDWKGMK